MSDSWHPSIGRRTISVHAQPVEMTLEMSPEGVQAVGRWLGNEIRETGRTIAAAEEALYRSLSVLIESRS